MAIELRFAGAIAQWQRDVLMRDRAIRSLNRSEARKAERVAAAEAEGRTDYKPRRWFANETVRQIAKERDRKEQESVKWATGVRSYTFHGSEEARLAAIRESNRRASQKRRDRLKAGAAG